ncbi:MAG: hypothetical protein NC213_08970, partial [Acetobacter sp.]|nr:hypothetical protein [Acetobacter sp.]
NYNSKRYKKYINNYYFYFFPTVSNSPKKIMKAELSIVFDVDYFVTLKIKTDENDNKEYSGKLLLSKDYPIGYISLKGQRIGEIVHLSFFDPSINGNAVTITTILGAMISISSGDSKRAPVMSRFFISKEDVSESDYDIIKSHLYLNSKFINISSELIEVSLSTIDIDDSQKTKILSRLTSAFEEKKYFKIEESYLLNTLKNDCNLSSIQVEQIISQLRLNSEVDANIKINKSLDSRLFNYLSHKN